MQHAQCMVICIIASKKVLNNLFLLVLVDVRL